MKIVFLGTPDFAAPILNAILASRHEVSAVVCQPDKVNARGNKVVYSPVKEIALKNNLPLYQFEKISRDGVAALKDIDADIMVTAAYGQILSEEVLKICPHGVINVHGSVLPKYRGASPVQWALINGEKRVGVTIMQTALAVDSGDILLIKEIDLSGDENAAEVLSMLSKAGGEAIVEALNLIESGKAVFTPQNHAEATFCKKIDKEDGRIDFTLPAEDVKNFIRGMTPSPSAYTDTPCGRLKILRAAVSQEDYQGVPGQIVKSSKNGFTVQCGKGALDILDVQLEGSRAMECSAFCCGHKIAEGTVLK